MSIFIILLIGISSCKEAPKAPKRLSKAQRQKILRDSLAHFSALPETVKHPIDNPYSEEKARLGKFLFFDPILSGNRDVACASCHHPSTGFAENRDISIGVNGQGLGSSRHFKEPNDIPFTKRNAHTVLNTAFNGINIHRQYDPASAPMFWDLRAQSLEQQALEPIKALEEMRGHTYSEEEILPEVVRRLNQIPEYQQLFEAAFGESESISIENMARAIACYERTLVSKHTRFDRFLLGDKSALSFSEQDGFRQFIFSGCGNCHNGPMLSDYQEHVLGVPDNPKLTDLDQGIEDRYAFRTPSLRNLRFTSPYMHNGSFHSLRKVLEFYEDISGSKMRNPNISKEQLDPLVREIDLKVIEMGPIISFLNSINDPSFDKSAPESVPSGLAVGGEID